MESKEKTAAGLLMVLLAAAIYGAIHTAATANGTAKNNVAPAVQQGPIVDQSSLKAAQQLSQLSLYPDERPFSAEALRLSDFDLDLAFAQALRDAKEHPPALSAEAKKIQGHLERSEQRLDADKTRVDQLTASAAKASAKEKDQINDEVDIVKAQAELDQDEVDDAKQDLIRAGGDPEGRIKAMVAEHEALAHNAANQATVATAQLGGLLGQARVWLSLHQRQMALWQAKAKADSNASTISSEHNTLDAKLESQKSASADLAHHSKDPATAAPSAPTVSLAKNARSKDDSRALIQKTKQISSDQKTLIGLDKRADTQKDLSNTYSQWIGVVAAHQSVAVHGILVRFAIILGIALFMLLFDNWLEKLLGSLKLDRRQIETLRTVTRVSLQVLAVLLILLIIFGIPGQVGTFLGLAGAGLTVALKDFIVGFLGWFVLMGKNGIRLGDWVEINGVTGEVVELGMFHTVLLETGNWTDSGHPTGRRVTFTNSFAIEGHYFNFSTSGQWLWDELQVVLPTGQDPYPIVDAIQKRVIDATAESAHEAEQEWQRAANSRHMTALSAAPAINIRPVVGGIEIAVRYITRANERYQLRAKLYQAAVDLLGGKPPTLPEAKA
jgi:small-conductance mechanosensitive channel